MERLEGLQFQQTELSMTDLEDREAQAGANTRRAQLERVVASPKGKLEATEDQSDRSEIWKELQMLEHVHKAALGENQV